MSMSSQVVRGAIASLIALGVSAAADTTMAAQKQAEKCAGIVKAEKNDCGTSTTSCHGSVKQDRHPEAWIEVPKGTCEKIAGAYVTTSPYAGPGGKGGN